LSKSRIEHSSPDSDPHAKQTGFTTATGEALGCAATQYIQLVSKRDYLSLERTPRPEEIQEDPPEQIENLEHPAFIARFGRSGQADGICGRDNMARRRRPPSQGWRPFLLNHADGIASIDLFVVPTILFKLLYGLLILRHDRRRILWVGVTTSPTAEWIARQVNEACGWEPVPDSLVRDRDRVYGGAFTRRIRAMGIRDRPTAPRSPWQNGYAERLIGSIRRECLDHVIVFGERHLWHVLRSYAEYYNGARTHLSLAKDSPFTRPVQRVGSILPQSVLGGLHHHYVRL
jgi:hypothetical protein